MACSVVLRSAVLLAGLGFSYGLLGSVYVPSRALSVVPAVSMKVFAWKTRGDPPPPIETLDLSNLKGSPGAAKSKTRKGRGISAGQGATCGFGTGGQKSRSGSPTRPGFEGGQIPLYRRLPKYVGRPMGMSHTKKEYGLIKTSILNDVPESSVVDYSTLMDQRLVSKTKYTLTKVVCGPEPLSVKSVTVKAHAFTASAREMIEANGGTCVVLSPTTNKPIGEEVEAPSS